jgi:hypothetical protein
MTVIGSLRPGIQIDTAQPRNVAATPSGSNRISRHAIRGYRFAQPPANGCDPFRGRIASASRKNRCHSILTSAVVVLLAGVVMLSAPVAARAQSPLEISIDRAPSSPPIRSDAPLVLVWRVRSQSGTLLEGKLEVTVIDNFEPIAQAVVDDVVVTPGEQLIRTVLPAVESNNQFNSVGVRVRFVTKGQKYEPEEGTTIPAPNPRQRALVLLVCNPWQTSLTRDKQQLVDRLHIGSWNANPDKTISTFPAHVRPEDLPADPLGYCGCDVAVLADEGFSELKEGQLRSILDWVEAGGSLCVIPGRGLLKEYHAKFLNQSAHSGSDQPRFVLDPSGRLAESADPGENELPPLLKRHGLGRVVLVAGKLDRLLAERESDVRRMLGFLWKLRRDRLEEFVKSGSFAIKTDVPVDEPKPGDSNWESYNLNRNVSYAGLRKQDHQLAQLPLQSGDQLLSRLLPQGLQVVPMSLIGVILIIYVVLIGPADWLILGALQRRKWTWVLFPFVTLALTLGTVWLAEWYMQVRGNPRSVTFHDVGQGQKIARRNRFEVLFLGSERFVNTDITREVFTAMTLQRFSSGMWRSYQEAQLQQGDQSHKYTKVAKTTGRVPAHYTVTQFISQWTPQLNRRFSIPVSGETPGDFDWNRFADPQVYNPSSVIASGKARNDIIESARQTFGATAIVSVVAGGKMHHLAGDGQLFKTISAPYGYDPYGNPVPQAYYQQMAYQAGAQGNGFLEDVALNSLGGFFAVVSQISPSGGKDFEDMTLVDPSDPAQWLLIVAVDRGDDLDIYRKLYTGGE